jgi:hypothetical protein
MSGLYYSVSLKVEMEEILVRRCMNDNIGEWVEGRSNNMSI